MRHLFSRSNIEHGHREKLVSLDRENAFEMTFFTERILQAIGETNWLEGLQVFHLRNVTLSGFFSNQDPQRLSNQFKRRSAKEVCSGFVDTTDTSFHVARVD